MAFTGVVVECLAAVEDPAVVEHDAVTRSEGEGDAEPGAVGELDETAEGAIGTIDGGVGHVGEQAQGVGETYLVDSIPVEMGAGTLEVRFRPSGPSPNLHAEVRLTEDDGRLVWRRTSDMPAGEVWVATSGMPAGRYAVEIWPAGYSVSPTEFTSYGSMGHYEIEITAPPPVGAGAEDVSAVSRAVRVSRQPTC